MLDGEILRTKKIGTNNRRGGGRVRGEVASLYTGHNR